MQIRSKIALYKIHPCDTNKQTLFLISKYVLRDRININKSKKFLFKDHLVDQCLQSEFLLHFIFLPASLPLSKS